MNSKLTIRLTGRLTFLLTSLLFALCFLFSCSNPPSNSIRLSGTWQLLTGTTITKGVATVTDYTKGQRMIKIINDSYFAFLRHDLDAPKDSSNHFDAGGGSYTLTGDQYTEHLDFYTDRHWEGKPFTFTVSINNDTLIQRGLEKVENEGIDRQIIEKYIRVKN
jgi:hypothetical protein